MNSERLQKLINYYKQEPEDPFIVYGLALEYEKFDLSKAIEYYEILLNNHPEYLATYYQVAHLYWELEDIDKAREIFIKGISLAESQQNMKILKELKAAFHNFQMENDY